MASFSVDGLGQAINQLEQANLFDDDTKKEMLFAAGDIFVELAKSEMAKTQYRMDKMIPQVKYRRTVKTDKYGCPYIKISVYGKTSKGTKHSVVAFVLNYGRDRVYGRIHGAHFWNKAREAAEPMIEQKVREIADKKLKERGLI